MLESRHAHKEETLADQQVSYDILERYRKVGTATVYSGVNRLGFGLSVMCGVSNFTPGKRLAGRAKTLRFVPPRTDIKEEAARGRESAEYRAMGSCGPGDVLVCDGLGKTTAAVGGDIKLLQLKLVGAEGLVTDASVRDMNAITAYGYAVFTGGRTPATGPPQIAPHEDNVVIQCGGVAVRPGDVIVGDDDGVVVVPSGVATDVIEWCEEHEEAEEYIKDLIVKENVSPGNHYTSDTFKRFHQERRR